ncbi:hypothetical protein [Methanococcoides sp. LMO-2]|uniref:Uncharacterized protein n=1 Tax=Methanococcoides cohabitans TaxID=3136559 RepID=A0ABU9KW31_9EURY
MKPIDEITSIIRDTLLGGGVILSSPVLPSASVLIRKASSP